MVVRSFAADQEPACLLTQLLTMTTTYKLPSLVLFEDNVAAFVKVEDADPAELGGSAARLGHPARRVHQGVQCLQGKKLSR